MLWNVIVFIYKYKQPFMLEIFNIISMLHKLIVYAAVSSRRRRMVLRTVVAAVVLYKELQGITHTKYI